MRKTVKVCLPVVALSCFVQFGFTMNICIQESQAAEQAAERQAAAQRQAAHAEAQPQAAKRQAAAQRQAAHAEAQPQAARQQQQQQSEQLALGWEVPAQDISAAQFRLSEEIAGYRIWNACDVTRFNNVFVRPESKRSVGVINEVMVGVLLSLYDVREACCLNSAAVACAVDLAMKRLGFLESKVTEVDVGWIRTALRTVLKRVKKEISQKSPQDLIAWIDDTGRFALENILDMRRGADLSSDFIKEMANEVKRSIQGREALKQGGLKENGFSAINADKRILWPQACAPWLQ